MKLVINVPVHTGENRITSVIYTYGFSLDNFSTRHIESIIVFHELSSTVDIIIVYEHT